MERLGYSRQINTITALCQIDVLGQASSLLSCSQQSHHEANRKETDKREQQDQKEDNADKGEWLDNQ